MYFILEKWLWISVLLYFTVQANDLMVVETEETVSHEVSSVQTVFEVHPEVFVASKEWKEILPNQAIPRGLHVRIDMQTGKKEARLLQDDNTKNIEEVKEKDDDVNDDLKDKSDEAKADLKDKSDDTKADLDPEEVKRMLKNLKNDMKPGSEQPHNKFRSMDEIRAELSHGNTKIESEVQIITRFIDTFEDILTTESDLKDVDVISSLVNILDNLEYYLHKYDNAVDFITLKGVERVLKPSLNSSATELQEGAAFIIGSAAQSNPKVQIAFLEAGFINILLRKITPPHSVRTGSKCLYALAAILRNFPEAQHMFIHSGGIEVFQKLFNEDESEQLNKIKIKILTLVQDLIDERDNLDSEHPSAEDKEKQYNKSDFIQVIKKSGWCEVYRSCQLWSPGHLKDEQDIFVDHDRNEKVVTAMLKIKPICDSAFLEHPELRISLEATMALYTGLQAEQGEDEFYASMVESIQSLLSHSTDSKHKLNSLKTEL